MTEARVKVGCDVQSVAAVTDALDAFGPRYLDRVYTPIEQESLARSGAAGLAARFAAKEAVLKLLDVPDGIDLRWIEIRTGAHGEPRVHLTCAALRAAQERGLGEIELSLSHDGGVAIALAASLAGRPPTGSSASVQHRPQGEPWSLASEPT